MAENLGDQLNPTAKEAVSQPSIENRTLILEPDQFANHLMWRRQRLTAVLGGKTTLKNPDEPKQLQQEIKVLLQRANELKEDAEAPNQETIRARMVAVVRELEKKSHEEDPFAKKGLQIRKRLLESRSAYLYSTGPIIRTLERHRWKADERHNGKALPLDQWGQISPRLLANPEANLDELQELNWYINSQSAERYKEIRSLSEQMKPIGDEVRAVVTMPAYKEGKNIYTTLMNYVGQTEIDGRPLDYKKVRFVVFDNWPEDGSRDQTGAEVRRFIEDAKKRHPELQVDYVKAVFTRSSNPIANIRNMMTSAVIENAARNRRKPTGDLIFVSNDADIPVHGVKPTYVTDIIKEFDQFPRMDAMEGKIDFPKKLMAQLPVQYATRRLWQYMDLVQMHQKNREPFLVGRNSAMRLKMIAAVGNYDPADRAGEDVEIGNKIKWARSWNPERKRFERERTIGGVNQSQNRVRYVHHISMLSDPRRDIVRLIGRERIRDQYSAFEKDQAVRGKGGEELTKIAVDRGFSVFNKALFEEEAALFYYDALSWAKWGGIETFKRAMDFLGAKYEIVDGKFKLTDTTVLEKGLQEQAFSELYRAPIEKWLKIKIKEFEILSGGVNNRVFLIRTQEGKNLVVRMSTQERSKFTSELWAFEQVQKNNVPVPKVIAVDTSKKIVPGYTISVSEKLPGTPLSDLNEKRRLDRTFFLQAGRALRGIHNVRITRGGWGYIDSEEKGSYPTWEDFVLRPCDRNLFSNSIQRGLIKSTDIDLAMETLRRKKNLLTNVPQQLVHGDFSLGNMLQKDNRLVGVLDFENAISGDPVWDLAYFSLYEDKNIIKDGFKTLLQGYGKPNLLDDPTIKERFRLYKLSNILYALKWYGENRPDDLEGLGFLNTSLGEALQEISDQPLPEENPIGVVSRLEINQLLKKRFDGAIDWFKDFYSKGMSDKDQEFVTARKKYEQIKPRIDLLLQKGDREAKSVLLTVLKADSDISLTDKELRRQIDRLVDLYKRDPTLFTSIDSNIDSNNPMYRLILYARNRGKLARYEKEYQNLSSGINFRQAVFELAMAKTKKGGMVNILDEGGTFDLAIQQLSELLHDNVPGVKVKLASIAADDMAIKFSDCHRYPVTHKIADVHHLQETFAGEKRSLIVSQAAYKFFWDPVRAIVQTANSLENGGWAFLGDIQENVSFNFNSLFYNEQGKPLDPVKVIEYLNSLNLGYKFYVGSHIITDMGDRRRVLTLAIKKETDKDLTLPLYYGKKSVDTKDGNWKSPIVYILPSSVSAQQKVSGYTKVA